MRKFLTGDTHGMFRDIETDRMRRWNDIIGKDLTKDDILFILGDHGLLWGKERAGTMEFCENETPCTVVVIPGNHENYDMLDKLPTEERFGGEVQVVVPGKIYQLQHSVYTIGGQTFLAYGGGQSVDRYQRTEGLTWWPQEIPSKGKYFSAIDALEAHGWCVDVVLSHTAPFSIIHNIPNDLWIPGHFDAKAEDPTAMQLEVFYRGLLSWKRWFCGHFHIDTKVDGVDFLFNTIMELP